MSEIVVTGSSGFLGRALTMKLYKLHYDVEKIIL